jgi:hypothetical protein
MSRVDRDLVRGRRAAESVRATGGSAVEAALSHIEATFSPAMRPWALASSGLKISQHR